jgi:hypothetical protein
VKIDWVGFVTGSEVKDFSITSFPSAAASENFTAFEPGEENDLVRRWDGERFAVHLRVLDFKKAINSRRYGVTGITDPEPFALARLPAR